MCQSPFPWTQLRFVCLCERPTKSRYRLCNGFEEVKSEITDNSILFTSAGQGSKVLIAELLKLFPNISCIDIGSSFDFLCQRRGTRDRGSYDYNRELIYYNDLLPK